MKVNKLIKKASNFFSRSQKAQQKKIHKLAKIIARLKLNRDKLKKEHKKMITKRKKKEISKEYKAVVKLLHKAKKRYNKLMKSGANKQPKT